MNVQPPRAMKIFSVAENDVKSPLSGTGLRIPLSADAWVAVDFEAERRAPMSIAVSTRCREPRDSSALAIHPHAGGFVTMAVGEGSSSSEERIRVFAVNKAELKGDIRDWLRKTTSGDPLGEMSLARQDPVEVGCQSFLVEYGDIALVHLDFSRPPTAMLGVEIRVDCLCIAAAWKAGPGTRFQALDMLIHVQAANHVSFLFNEFTTFIIDETKVLGGSW